MPKILVIEDAPSLLRWLLDRIRLEIPAASVVGVMTAAQAMDRLAEHTPDLVVLDLAIPQCHETDKADPRMGMLLLKSIAALSPRPKVIAVSSLDLRDACLAEGANAFITKNASSLWPNLRDEITSQLTANNRTCGSDVPQRCAQ